MVKKRVMAKGQNKAKKAGQAGNKANKAGGPASPGMKDARLHLIKKHRSEMTDARDMLVKMAKGQDARAKLQKIRNLKEGKVRPNPRPRPFSRFRKPFSSTVN